MSKIILTIVELTVDRAVETMATSTNSVDGFEIRLDALNAPINALGSFRRATGKELILTRRSAGNPRPFTAGEIEQGIAAGFDWIDLEFSDQIDRESIVRFADRLILSHHDFNCAGDVSALYQQMKLIPAAKRKIAVTPSSFEDNEKLLETLAASNDRNLTVIGMGARGLYSRILAPFFGSELIFAARDKRSVAAPGQLTIERARRIYGDSVASLSMPTALFAVVGNPVSHSRSPDIHNSRFREAGIAAAYSMIEVERFEELAHAMVERRPFAPTGVSITSPFKEEAYRFARRARAQMTERAEKCRAVNTFVVFPDTLVTDNTDVVGFAAGLSLTAHRPPLAAVLGAGGAARAALVALREAAVKATIYNRTLEMGRALAREFGVTAEPLTALGAFDGAMIVNTLPGAADVEIPSRLLVRDRLYLDVSYGPESAERIARARGAGMRVFDGLDFLRAQAVPQSELFIRAARQARGERRAASGGRNL